NNTSLPVVTAVLSIADVSVSKSGPVNATPGANFSYTITVSNAGPSLASSLSVTDNLPAAISFVSSSAGGAFNGSSFLWTNFNLAAGAATNLIVTVTAPANPATLTNVASGASAITDPNPANNSSAVITYVGASADLAVSKIGPASVTAANNFDY